MFFLLSIKSLCFIYLIWLFKAKVPIFDNSIAFCIIYILFCSICRYLLKPQFKIRILQPFFVKIRFFLLTFILYLKITKKRNFSMWKLFKAGWDNIKTTDNNYVTIMSVASNLIQKKYRWHFLSDNKTYRSLNSYIWKNLKSEWEFEKIWQIDWASTIITKHFL